MRHGSRWALSIAMSASMCLLFGSIDARAQQPDFTGVWTTYTEPGQAGGRTRRRAAAAPERAGEAEGRQVSITRSSRRATRPGGFCLGTGMPGSMLGSGGYPMEIHQRPEQLIIVYEAHNEIRRVYLGDRIVPRGRSAAGPQWTLERSMGRQHAGRGDGESGRAGRSAVRPQQQGAGSSNDIVSRRASRARRCWWPR